MTFLELQDATLQACGHSTTASSDARTRIKRHLNQWQRRLLSRPGYTRLLRDSEITFASVADQEVYGLGLPMGRLNGIHERTNMWPLEKRDLSWLRGEDPGLVSAGAAQVYIPRGWFPVKKHPVAFDTGGGGGLISGAFLVSTAVGDTTQISDWELILSDFTSVRGSTTMTGTTPVLLGGYSTVVEVVKFSLRTAATGVVTLKDNGSLTLLSLPIGQLYGRFFHIQLWPTPASAITYRVDYTREIQDMAQDTDQPLLPPDFHAVLQRGAEYEEWRKLDDDRAAMVRQELEDDIRSLSHWLWDLADRETDGVQMHSRLGAWFPSGT